MRFLKNILISAVIIGSSFAYAEGTDLTSDPDHRAFVSKLINKELQHVNKKLKVTKVTKITSEYDPSSGIYFMETEFKFLDPKGKIQSCDAMVITDGLNHKKDRAEVPYVCFRIAGLG